jgi:hypothetical protein
MKKYLLLVVLCCALIPQVAMADDAYAGAKASGSASYSVTDTVVALLWGILTY